MRQYRPERMKELLSDPMKNLSAVAKLARISRPQLTLIRDGECTPNVNTLVSIADTVKVPLDYFFE